MDIDTMEKVAPKIKSQRPPVGKSKVRKRKPLKEKDYKKKIPKFVEERFDKAFFLTLFLIAILFLLIFIPLIGFVLVLTITPYYAGYKGGRYVSKRNGLQVGVLVGFIWSIILTYILFETLKMVQNVSEVSPGIYSSLDFFIVSLIFIFNILFCGLGGYTGGRNPV
jgi:hypothetical protein